jgi:hypothetical protein
MIGKLLKWAGFDRPRTSRSSGRRPVRSLGRRLAFESVERRVLLSANGNEPVAEGGTVYMEYGGLTIGNTLVTSALSDQHQTWHLQSENLFAGLDVTVNDAYILSGDGDSVLYGELQIKPTGTRDTAVPFFRGMLYSADDRGADSFTGSLSGIGTASITAPKSEELPLRDIASIDLGAPLGDRGMVDVGRIGRPELDATIRELDWSKPPGTASETQLADANAAAAGSSIQTVAYRPARSLAGSRSRLAAFDLAMRDDAFDRHAHLEHAAQGNHAVDTPTPAVETNSPHHRSPQVPTLSSLPGTARRAQSERQIAAHDLALANFAVSANHSPDFLETTLVSRSAQSTTITQDGPTGDQLADARAAFLNQRREKPVVHLVAAVGIGSALATTPWDSAPQAQQEQLPPRKRQARRTSRI